MTTAKESKKYPIVVLDTNIIVSSVVFGGRPRDIFLLVIKGKIKAYYSSYILFEITDVLRNKFEFNEDKIKVVEKIFKTHFIKVLPKSIPQLSKDPSDNKILAVALVSKANYLITGDKKHLLPLKKIKNCKIITVEKYLKKYS